MDEPRHPRPRAGLPQPRDAARLTRTRWRTSGGLRPHGPGEGLLPRRITGVHTLRSSPIPVVTSLGVASEVLMGGAVVTETIFNVPGIGRVAALSASVGRRERGHRHRHPRGPDLLVANLLVDILYAASSTHASDTSEREQTSE